MTGTHGSRSPSPLPALDSDTVVVGLCEEPDMLVQDFSLRHATWAVLSTLMLKLTRYDDSWRAWPELAEELPTVANGGHRTLEDGRTEITWRLRRGLRWQDGVPVTAHDALFTYELLKATPPPYPHHTIIESISEMIVPAGDPYTLIIRWSADKAFAPHEEWGTVLPRHLLENADLQIPEIRDRHPFLRSPVFQGPYRLEEWKPGEHITVIAAEPHPRGGPLVRRIVFRFYPGPRELREAVLTGEVDVTDLTGFDIEDAAVLESAAPAVDVHYTPALTWEHIDLNLDDPVLARREVRRALAHAIDRRELSQRLYQGRQPIAHSWLPARHPAAADDVRRYDHDRDRAGALLDAAGFRRGADGMRRAPDGSPLVLELLTTRPAEGGRWTASAQRPEAADLIREQLGRVGVGVQVELLPADEAFPVFRRRKFRHMAMFAWSMGLETTGYLMWHSSKIPDDNEWYGINVSGWRHAENDGLLDRMAAEHDEDERHDLMRRQQRLWAEELPSLPLYFPVGVSTAKRGLRNIRPVGVFGSYVTWNAWEWEWTPPEAP
ncbi:peptide ABC transporter substrate-binding protein [Actinomadura sp. 3N407]|uniref:peptide ABC transporter substrate-binding protein n=1 Tax=Actinomadura sp. 3N407 TaxID=3457423 RepID=UPI003FCD119F